MLNWIKKHPLLLQLASVALLFLFMLLLYFIAPIREQLALKQFRANHPDCRIHVTSRSKSPRWLSNLLAKVKLEHYATRVQGLQIHGHFHAPRKISSVIDLHFLIPFTQVSKLEIITGFFSPESFSQINHLKHLKQLRINNCEITGRGSLMLKDLEHLKEIRTNYFKLKEIELQNLPSLVALDLKNSNIGDELFDHLGDVSKTIEILGLANTNITDAGLLHLNDFPKLKSVDLRFTRRSITGYPNFTWKGIVQLNKHPTLESIGLRHTFAQTDLDKINTQAPRYASRWNDPVKAIHRKMRFLSPVP